MRGPLGNWWSYRDGEVRGRTRDDEITCFYSKGMGLQFAAVGALSYRRAREKGVGIELKDEWFLQNVQQR